jgi:hypothetical protein
MTMYVKADEMERRCLPTAELRIAEDSPKITGYAAVFDTWADIGGWFRESIKPGAFAKTIKENDVRALLNHDPNFVLGRNKAGTLKLREDSKGLAVEIDPVDSLWANDLLKSMRRGDVNQMSFQFNANKEDVDYEKDERTLIDVTLYDVSIVTFPAYPTTSAQVRAAFVNKGKRDWLGLTPPKKVSVETTEGGVKWEVNQDISEELKRMADTTGNTSTTGTTPLFRIVYGPTGFSELDRIIRKLIMKEELTEEELRVVAAHYPDLSVPPAKHTETPTEPPAKHSDGDTRKDKWTELFIRAERIAPSKT